MCIDEDGHITATAHGAALTTRLAMIRLSMVFSARPWGWVKRNRFNRKQPSRHAAEGKAAHR
jgi:hypothetical protein